MSIVSIKKRARADTLEVEHLLKEASHPNEALATVLDELSAELQWPVAGTRANGNLLVPLATWAKVVSTYCRDGFRGLICLSDDPSLGGFIIGLLEELKTKEAFDTLLLAYDECLREPCRDIGTSLRLANAVNLMLSFKSDVVADAAQTVRLRTFLYGLYTCAESDAQRASALAALRGVGDEDSAEFAASKSLSWPWHDLPRTVVKHIKARLRAAATQTTDSIR
jgi:hypothetical protein